MKDILIDDRYRLVRKVADGGWSTVFIGIDVNSGEEVAVKLENQNRGLSVIEAEKDLYETFAGAPGIPRVRWTGEEGHFNIMISDLLGPSLTDLCEFCDSKFSLKTVLLLADQMICRIKYIHSKGYLHMDIKPDNFLMGIGRLGNLVHIIDFGITRSYLDSDGKHRLYSEKATPAGTMSFCSLNTHSGIMPSRRDDLESLGYTLIYLHRGFLPWISTGGEVDLPKDVTQREINRILKERKLEHPIEELCDGLPTAFFTYFNYVRSLEYDARPNYTYLRKLFSDLFARRRYTYDNIFDWTIKQFSILHHTPAAGDQADVQEVPEVPEVPAAADQAAVPDVPDVPDAPDAPDVPNVPDVPDVPDIPDVPDVPNVPDVPEDHPPAPKRAKKTKKAKEPKQGPGPSKAKRSLRSVKGKGKNTRPSKK